ncbi:MAG: RluA family pseudouridine synthase [Vicinamibacteria bacterium]|nr:RluA family pseudouridine synthase [Vicinamibacteria bacterium]
MVPIHEDDDLIAVAKPPGVAVIPARGEEPGASLHKRLEAERGERLYVVHRIDRETSGVVVFARHAEAHRALSMAFERRQVEKEYVAFVAGEPPADGAVTVALVEARRGRARPVLPGEPGGRDARTEYVRERAWRDVTDHVARLRLRPRTGRHHQIRVHLRFLGVPILGDDVYGRAALPLARDLGVTRLALHAGRLAVPTASGAPLALCAPLWPDLADLNARLDAVWRS